MPKTIARLHQISRIVHVQVYCGRFYGYLKLRGDVTGRSANSLRLRHLALPSTLELLVSSRRALERLECKFLRGLVGARGFEPPASWSRTRRSSQAEPRPESTQCIRILINSFELCRQACHAAPSIDIG